MELDLGRGLVLVLRRSLLGFLLKVGGDGCSGGSWYWIERVGRVCAMLERWACRVELRMWLSGRRRLVDKGAEGMWIWPVGRRGGCIRMCILRRVGLVRKGGAIWQSVCAQIISKRREDSPRLKQHWVLDSVHPLYPPDSHKPSLYSVHHEHLHHCAKSFVHVHVLRQTTSPPQTN
jgi:hypothetical protein